MRLFPSDPDIATVVRRIRDWSLDLQPDFQRGAVWSKQKQRLLIDSILRNWYVPPIHVVRTESDEQVVLDGQQRLRAISDFVEGLITVDGRADPFSLDIAALDGTAYEQLPEAIQRRFDRFTLRIFEVVDYEPEEPYELFYRLNQPTTLTSAEKRNAFFGPPREQVKILTAGAELAGMTPDRVGFSNSRLAYEDVVARFVFTLELGTLGERISAGRLTERYRSNEPFDGRIIDWAERCLADLFRSPSLDDPRVRLNKATTHSWLCFAGRGARRHPDLSFDGNFLSEVERRRGRYRRDHLSDFDSSDSDPGSDALFTVLNDRATSRVNDVTSVLLRDAILWVLFARKRPEVWNDSLKALMGAADSATTPFETEEMLLSAAADVGWERLE